jgi:hypothetical protein
MRPAALLKRLLIFVHRWLGVALSVIFTLWFASGIVMMYWTFPEVTPDDRLARAPTLRASQIRVSPEDAYAALGREEPPASVQVESFDGRPVYRFGGNGRGRRGGAPLVYADTGMPQSGVDAAMIDRAAAAWARRPASEATKVAVEAVDQWTVAGALQRMRPLFKYTWPDGQQVYVNGNSAQVVQYTTTASRTWAYLGAIPHWMYFTPLRTRNQQWFSFVVWASLIGTISAILGVVIAIWMLSPRRSYRHAGAPTMIPYRGWKRWHTIIGLVFGVVTTTWVFSGLLSMGPFPITERLAEITVPSEPAPGDGAESNRARGGGDGSGILEALGNDGSVDFGSFAARPPAAAIASVPGFEVKQLEYRTFAGEPLYLATDGRGQTRIIPVVGAAKTSFDIERIASLVREAAGADLAELRVLQEYDAYYLDRHGDRPLPVIYARMNDAGSTRYYVDPKTAEVVGVYNARGWVERWLYHGLHSLDFPWLYKHRPLWDVVVITLLLGGTAICVTSLVLAWQVLVRKVSGIRGQEAGLGQQSA